MTRWTRQIGRGKWALLLMGSLLCVPACEEDTESTSSSDTSKKERREARKKAKAAAAAKATDEAKEAEVESAEPVVEYVYNPLGKRDPFKSFLKLEQGRQQPTTPLQRYDLEQYRLVGIVSGGAEPLAMVEDPEGNGHFLRPGTLIGKNWGKVVRISTGNVVVAEETTDIQGQLHVNEVVMAMEDEG